MNSDSNYDEKFWDEISKEVKPYEGYMMLKTKKLDFYICTYMTYEITKNGEIIKPIVDI